MGLSHVLLPLSPFPQEFLGHGQGTLLSMLLPCLRENSLFKVKTSQQC